MAFYTVGGKNYTLASSISSTATSITLTSFTLPITDQAITMATANTSIMYGTLQPGTTNSEFISFTGITQNANGTATLTGVTRGLDREYPYTTDSTFKLPHPGQSIFILSDAPQVFNKYAALDNAQTFADVNTFTVSPIVPTPTTATQAANKSYVDGVAIAGAPNATTTVQGLVELATQAEVDARTATGGTGASLVATPALNRNILTHDYAADAGSTDAYAITLTPAVTAYTTGDIYYFKANTINTGACTLNVNSLGARSLKFGGSDPYTGFIAASAYVACQYDGTNLNIIWCSSAPALSQGQLEIYGADSVGTDAYAITPSPAISAYAAGQVFRVKLGTANTGACTLAVSGLSALAIKKNYNADTITGDLLANQVIEVAYDSTNTCWQLLSPVAQSVKYANGSTSKNSADASTTQNIAHGLGVAPKYVKITALNADTAIANGTAPGFYYSYTTYNGTTQSSLSINRSSTTTVLLSTDFRLTSGSAALTDYTAGVVTVDATNIIITWTKTGSPTGTYNLVWEAQT